MDTTMCIEMKLHQYVVYVNFDIVHSRDENKSEIALHHFSTLISIQTNLNWTATSLLISITVWNPACNLNMSVPLKKRIKNELWKKCNATRSPALWAQSKSICLKTNRDIRHVEFSSITAPPPQNETIHYGFTSTLVGFYELKEIDNNGSAIKLHRLQGFKWIINYNSWSFCLVTFI